jgi:hypothetical protein
MPSACASDCNMTNTKPGSAVDATRQRLEHDPGTRAGAFRSGAQHMRSARAISVRSDGRVSHRPKSTHEGLPVCAVIVAHQIGRCCAPRECLHDLLRQPLRGRMPRHREPEQLSSTVAQHEKRKQALECQRWNHAKVDRRDGVCMVAQECPPSLRWWPSAPDHVFGDRRLGDLEPELEQFTMDARGAPQWVLPAHPLDEFAQLTADSGPAWPTARFPAPVSPKSTSMPPQDGGWLNNSGQTEQTWPEPGHPHQKRPITPTKPWTVRCAP